MPTPTLKYRPHYYPFGSSLNTRSFSAGNGFRFGFNGKENFDKYQDYGMRIYYPSLGKFLSVDPLAMSFSWNSTYAFAENDLIRNIDLDGVEKYDYKLSLTKQGKSKMELVKTTDIIDNVFVRNIYSDEMGYLSSEPIYEKRVNQRQEYTINNKKASLNTVQELQGTKTADPIIQAGMNKITSDYAHNGGQFSDNYNVVFGKFIFEQGFKKMGGCTEADFTKSADETWDILDNAKFSKGAALFHLYDNFVRKNDNTGYDKLLHFSKSAQLTIKFGSNTSKFLGVMKEFWKDELPSWSPWSKDEGWDNNDMTANQDGINFGNIVNQSCENNSGEFCK